MSEDRLITVAIHTYQKAVILKTLLENEGISATLQNVNLVQPVVSSGVRVRIHETDLPKALKIIENCYIYDSPEEPTGADSRRPCVLVPVDFSSHSTAACLLAFRFAAAYHAEIVLLHCFISPTLASNFQLTDSISFDFDNFADEEMLLSIEDAATKRLSSLARDLRIKMKSGEIPPVKFSTRVIDEVPEDAINAVAKELKPLLIVMGTRGAGTKGAEMVGSVTAEVLDTCRFPVFTVPEGFGITSSGKTATEYEPKAHRHVLFFCNYEQTDLIALDTFYRLFPNADIHVTLANIPSKKFSGEDPKASAGLMKYCEEHLPRFSFDIRWLTVNDMEAEFQQIEHSDHIDFVCIADKKRNALTRLFNPGLAHRLLFHTDIPMMVIPV